MIAKITSGGGFRGVLNYLMKQKEQAHEVNQERSQKRDPESLEGERQNLAQNRERQEQAADFRLQGDGRASEWGQTAAEPISGKVTQGGKQGCLEKTFEKEKGTRHQLIGGNMSGRTTRELAREFGAMREQRPDIEKPVHHVSLSAAVGDHLTINQWNQIAGKYVEQMGFRDSQYVIIKHTDTKHDHVHIVASRITLHGKVVKDFQNKRKAEAVMREVEREHKLEQVRSSTEVERAAPKRGETERFIRTKEMSAKMSLQGHVDRALRGGRTANEFVERLKCVGVEVIPYVRSTGQVTGISFKVNKEMMKGSDLGRGYSWQSLQNRGLKHEPERDLFALRKTLEQILAKQVKEMNHDETGRQVDLRHVEASRETTMRSVGQHALDRVNPLLSAVDQAPIWRRGLKDGSATEQGMTSREVTERLQRAAGVVIGQDERCAIERINRTAGVEEQPRSLVAPLELERSVEKDATGKLEERTLIIEHTKERESTEKELTQDRSHHRSCDHSRSR